VQSIGQLLRDRLRGVAPGNVGRLLLVAVPALAAASALVWLLEERFGIPDASPVYLLAVVVTARLSGTVGALAAAVFGILLYDFLFTHPFGTLEISDPGEWLSLVLLLFVGLVVGQLTALERSRTLTAEAREREARELFLVSVALATRSSTTTVLSEIATLLRRAADMTALWISLGSDEASEHVAAEAGPREQTGGLHWQLRRFPGEQPAQWVRIHQPTPGRSRAAGEPARGEAFRVRIEAGGHPLGSIWAVRERGRGLPDRSATRLMSAGADQIGQALAQDRLAADAQAADVARQSDALKSALLQSVSHDLRTPLATIRAAAGTLQPDSDLDAEGRRASAAAIEREVERLDRLVANLLDLGRIEAGALRAELDVFELDDLAGRTLDRFSPRLAGHEVRVEVPAVPVLVDPVFLDEALTNVLDNALKFTGPNSLIRVWAGASEDDVVRLVVEDDGAGVSDEHLGRVFEKFFRAPSNGTRGRAGTGIGLAVVRGLVEAMGGTVTARRGDLGGLAVEMELKRARLPAELTPATA
jgi:two-component system sensor histidine kinase KdpD